ncbi:hypothetical protein TNCT_718741 [Trichonephila clavata]|uniref:Uncharacterized protein n=1 Tax=Trichonephila clavata TaxID=2740835 RepID=A0A8X6LC14_TRICU|nr:hypothetical protein TNCT_718741 [Trichonephila clavata]
MYAPIVNEACHQLVLPTPRGMGTFLPITKPLTFKSGQITLLEGDRVGRVDIRKGRKKSEEFLEKFEWRSITSLNRKSAKNIHPKKPIKDHEILHFQPSTIGQGLAYYKDTRPNSQTLRRSWRSLDMEMLILWQGEGKEPSVTEEQHAK